MHSIHSEYQQWRKKYDIPVEMSTDEFVDCLLCKCMTILEFMQRSKLLYIETIRQNDI